MGHVIVEGDSLRALLLQSHRLELAEVLLQRRLDRVELRRSAKCEAWKVEMYLFFVPNCLQSLVLRAHGTESSL